MTTSSLYQRNPSENNNTTFKLFSALVHAYRDAVARMKGVLMSLCCSQEVQQLSGRALKKLASFISQRASQQAFLKFILSVNSSYHLAKIWYLPHP